MPDPAPALLQGKLLFVSANFPAWRYLGYHYGTPVAQLERKRVHVAGAYAPEKGQIVGRLPAVAQVGAAGADGQSVEGIENYGEERWLKELQKPLQGKTYGSPCATFRLVDIHVADRVRNLLRRRHKLPRATSRFGYNEVHGSLGVIEVRRLLSTHACT
jgi:hypothetical protein